MNHAKHRNKNLLIPYNLCHSIHWGIISLKIKGFRIIYLIIMSCIIFHSSNGQSKTVWQIGESDNSGLEFALAPNAYDQFIEHDFGWEDRFFLVGTSSIQEDWPYILPGPSDKWGGTWSTSGWRSHTLNILFGIDKLPENEEWKLIIDLLDINADDAPVFKVIVNGQSWKYELPVGSGNIDLENESFEGLEHIIELSLPPGVFRTGGNEIRMTTIQGSWILFDQIRLEGPGDAKLKDSDQVFIRNVKAADYEIETEKGNAQPLLIDVEHLSGSPNLKVLLDNEEIFSAEIETGRYEFEAPMPTVEIIKNSTYSILLGEEVIQTGKVKRSPNDLVTLAEYVDTKMGTAHSRWMIAPGPWMPFSMVKLSADNQNKGWQAGYDPIFESVGGFSHIHEWTMGGAVIYACHWKTGYPGG